MILEIIKYPNDILTTPTEDLTKADILSSKIQSLIEDMIDTCLLADGLGLAANQVNVNKSLFIHRKPGTKGFGVVINPYVKGMKGRITNRGEGCLSLPGQYFDVKRFKKVTIKALDHYGEPVTINTSSKRTAKIFQHEIDHLNGISLLDRGKKV